MDRLARDLRQALRSVARSRLSAAFGLLATVLAAIGLYAVTSFSVARRTREIGLRMSQLVGLRASDPGTLSAATLALLTVVLLAGYVPAQRATRVDPMVALRIE